MNLNNQRGSRRQSAHPISCAERQRSFCDFSHAVQGVDRLAIILPLLGERAGVRAVVSTRTISP